MTNPFARRTILKVLLSIPLMGAMFGRGAVAATSPVSTVVDDYVHHPVFTVQTAADPNKPTARLLRVVKHEDSLGFRHFEEEPEAEAFGTISATEEHLFDQLQTPEIEYVDVPPDAMVGMGVAILINRAANKIAGCTRRGSGNVVLLHEDDLVHITVGNKAGIGNSTVLAVGFPIRSGRWTFAGTLNRSIQIWTTSELPAAMRRGHALVGYRGNDEADTGMAILKVGQHYRPVFRRNHPHSLGSGGDYFETVALCKPAYPGMA